MFEEFTDRTRKVVAYANQQAIRFNHDHIAPEHVLLGMVVEGSGVGVSVMRNLNVDPRRVMLEVEKRLKANPNVIPRGKLPQTPLFKKVVEHAIEESKTLGHSHVGTEHLLLGLLREPETDAAQVLIQLGLAPDAVRAEILIVLAKGNTGPEFNKYWPYNTPEAEQALLFAHKEAKTMGHYSIGTGHILIGLLREESGIAAKIMLKLGANLETVRKEIATLEGRES